MLRVGGRSAIAEYEQFPAGLKGVEEQIDRPSDGVEIRAVGNGGHVGRDLVKEAGEFGAHSR